MGLVERPDIIQIYLCVDIADVLYMARGKDIWLIIVAFGALSEVIDIGGIIVTEGRVISILSISSPLVFVYA
jgi:hypothetical protein